MSHPETKFIPEKDGKIISRISGFTCGICVKRKKIVKDSLSSIMIRSYLVKLLIYEIIHFSAPKDLQKNLFSMKCIIKLHHISRIDG
ncbi:MAG: hypothetical protein MRJ93_13465, partial [Nitrososphaeraceae archaeon]|nr:hypothetical protein [Nitrososphaeraceae archaeon]